MKGFLLAIAVAGLSLHGFAELGADPFAYIPEEAPRSWIQKDQREAFLSFSTTGEGKVYFERIRDDLDTYWMDWPMPTEPETYGDPDPRKRTSDKVDKWRGMQDLTGRLTGIAEAATLVWLVTGEEEYLTKAKYLLLGACKWDPLGSTGVDYNDEAHFRLLRKLPEIYDQIRDHLTEEERGLVLSHLRTRGVRGLESILDSGVAELKRNSIEKSPASHSVRFMAMTGQAALALWDDLPEARQWWEFVYTWYRDVFTPWGGDDGGWGEGIAYWRGVYEHAVFQDVLFNISDPLAYSQPFWKNTGYFQVYFVQPYLATGFGDLSNAGQFNMEPGVKHFLDHLANVTGNGYMRFYAGLFSDHRPLPREKGIKELYRVYPTPSEYWVREFIASRASVPKSMPLSGLPQSRHFKDVGWVSMHSELSNPGEDIMLSFKSSPYGSFSHSHGDQNSIIINAYGEQLAINSGYREYHRSQMHKYYTRQTISKNNILINRRGQNTQDKNAKGGIVRFKESARAVWTTGDATAAFNTMQSGRSPIVRATRDVVFVDNRYFIIRDHVVQKGPGRIDWLLHARDPITFHEIDGSVVIKRHKAMLLGRLLAADNNLRMKSWTGFPVDVDPKYKDMHFINTQPYLMEPAVDQAHFQANTVQEKDNQIVFAVLWPTRDAGDQAKLKVELLDRETLSVERPDGVVDRVVLNDEVLEIH